MTSKEEMARQRYGCSYERLSAFGKRDIDRAFQEPSYTAKLPATEEVSLRQVNAKLVADLEAANQENLDLWEQLTETREELETLRSQFNPPLS